MKYARIENSQVAELIETSGDITEMFPSELIWVDVSDLVGVAGGWVAVQEEGQWLLSPPPQVIPSEAEIRATNTAFRDQLLTKAALRINPLQDAVDLDRATDFEIGSLKQWKGYRVDVNRVDVTLQEPAWPEEPA